ncbi:cation-translocating P-type ATPase [Pandoraea pnomenusa]|uniref:cation-translocating P-type ATPase n=1 Tax=Pandoraea pnomenusa TaxID=93220 RepID=UPI00114786C3|nr:cation-translocating P-type ATPase [Pandoraea pnomenusa]QDH59824.1 cation-translocating P-type ATPase [Pandoraea pnomenusa]
MECAQLPCVDADRGLSTLQVTQQRARHGSNVVDARSRGDWRFVLADVLREPMFLLLLAASGVYFALGDRTEALTLCAFVLGVVSLTVYQSRRAARVLDSLRELSAPRAEVLRDGERRWVPATELVPGDIAFVDEGNRVPADGIVIEAHELSVDEALLTGESTPIDKRGGDTPAGADASTDRLLYLGSMVVRGQGRMRVIATGPDTALGRIGKSLGDISEAPSPLQRQAKSLVNGFALIALLLVVALSVIYRWRFEQWLPGLLAGITLAMGILPEEIPVIFAVFFALGARRIAGEGVLTRRMNAIETLGQTSVLCVDKTGTLTQNRMSVSALSIDGRMLDIGPDTAHIEEPFHELIEYLVLASEIDPVDPMERAFHAVGRSALAGTGRLHTDWSLVHEYALTPELPAMSHAWRTQSDSAYHAIACKGAPEAVCALCRMSATQAGQVLERARNMAARGLRVLGVAKSEYLPGEWPAHQHGFAFAFVGLVGLSDPVRPEVAGAIAECRTAGIRVVMMTGDYATTAQAIASDVGIDNRRVVTGRDLASMNGAALREAVNASEIFARISPGQKLQLVNALRENGEIVAMTGDGVNDAPALKAAHIGIAMGLRGAEVAREVAALVLLRDDFSPIVAAIRLGRRIYANIVLAINFTVAVHIPMVAAATLPVVAGLPPMLAPVHIVFLQLIIDPVCSIVFENEPGARNLMRLPPRPAQARLLDARALASSAVAGTLSALLVLAAYATLLRLDGEVARARTLAFVLLVVANVALIFVTPAISGLATTGDRPLVRNRYLWIVLVGTVVSLTLVTCVPSLARIFGFVALSGGA